MAMIMSTNGKLAKQMSKLMKQMLFAVVALFLASCSSEILTESGKSENESINLEITARQEQLQNDGNVFEPTRTSMSSNGTSVNWTEGDLINVFDGTSMRKFVASSVDATTCTFKAQGYGVAKDANSYFACYPYNMKQTLDGNTISNVTLPANQLAVEGGFDPACNLMVAKSSDIASGFNFKNICSYLRFVPGFDCSRIIIKFSDDNAKVTGTFNVTIGDDGVPSINNLSETSNTIELLGDIKQGKEYYVAILPGTYTGGFRVTLEPVATASNSTVNWENHTVNLNSQYKETANPITVNRSKIKSLGELKNGLTSSNGTDAYFVDIFDAEHQTDSPVVLWAKYNLGANSETEDGDHFAWGEIEPKSSYTEENYLCKDYYPSTLDKNHDAAAVRLGEGWKIPSQEEFSQLVNNTIWVYTSNYNNKAGYIIYPAGNTSTGKEIKGYQMNQRGEVYRVNNSESKVTDEEVIKYIEGLSPSVNERFIFLPKSNAIIGDKIDSKCAYWTNTHGVGELESSNSVWSGKRAAYYFGADGYAFHPNSYWSTIYQGLSIRPVFVLNR